MNELRVSLSSCAREGAISIRTANNMDDHPVSICVRILPTIDPFLFKRSGGPVEPPLLKLNDFLLRWYQLYPPVLRTAFCGPVGSDKVCLAVAVGRQPIGRYAILLQVVHDGIGALLG